ncbi:ABC-three component system middle component 5 [Burkholderia sp. SRS-W-2-2016]|uniref:ABC-three component system middle component 5 n=1 Tax=Burkholderia sp. SRS-W-2-2016 TaxID=1926878 RepID=UPI00117F95D4|nr:ABC-three component system middle component 5 [Burkholderia sp. SRS-W-2-2016]
MLIYEPALDPYHGAIRILAVAKSSSRININLSIDAARIADYFLVYPYKMLSFTFPAEYRSMRTAAKDTENPYRSTSGNRTAFERMRPIFFAALSGLVAANLLDADLLKRGILSLSGNDLPADLAAAVARFQDRQTVVGKFVLSDFLKLPVNGNNGLKHRSGLIEHRYDPA